VAPSTETINFSLGFSEPHLFGSNLGLEVGLHKRLVFREDYQIDSSGYTLGLSHPIVEREDDTLRLTGALAWRQEWNQVEDVEPDAVPGAHLFEGWNPTQGLAATLTLRALDDLVKPDWSLKATLLAEVLGGALGGEIDMVKIQGTYEQSWLVHEDEDGKRHRLTAVGVVGWSGAYGDTPEVPPFERFYAGGRNLRGFSYRGVGPHADGNPMGGEWLVTGSLEYEIPLVKDVLGMVFFADAGTLGTTLWDDDAFLWRLSVGLGARIKVPILGDQPLALDFGFPLLYEDDDERQMISFSAGRDF
jgi:outer membrane protein assembly factor BamA